MSIAIRKDNDIKSSIFGIFEELNFTNGEKNEEDYCCTFCCSFTDNSSLC